MSTLQIEGGPLLVGKVCVPPDKSVFHRAVFLSSISNGGLN